MRRTMFLAIMLPMLAAAPLSTAKPLALMRYLQGTWTCVVSIAPHGPSQAYSAVWSYDQDGTWLSEADTWKGGGDRLLLTYVSGRHVWRSVVAERNGNVTVFEAPDTGLAHLAFRSVYPDRSMQDTIDRVTFAKYTVHFRQQTANGVVTGSDVCTKRM